MRSYGYHLSLRLQMYRIRCSECKTPGAEPPNVTHSRCQWHRVHPAARAAYSSLRNSGAGPFKSPSGVYPRLLKLWKAGLFWKRDGSSKQPFAMVLHIHCLPVMHDHVYAHITDSALFTSWAAGMDARELGGTGQPSRFLHKDFLISSHASVLLCLCVW